MAATEIPALSLLGRRLEQMTEELQLLAQGPRTADKARRLMSVMRDLDEVNDQLHCLLGLARIAGEVG